MMMQHRAQEVGLLLFCWHSGTRWNRCRHCAARQLSSRGRRADVAPAVQTDQVMMPFTPPLCWDTTRLLRRFSSQRSTNWWHLSVKTPKHRPGPRTGWTPPPRNLSLHSCTKWDAPCPHSTSQQIVSSHVWTSEGRNSTKDSCQPA